MLEMTAGRVTTMSETYLGLRHGPISYVHDDTIVVCFLSSDTTLRAYEADLLRELDHKDLGLLKLIVGGAVAKDLARAGDRGTRVQRLRQARRRKLCDHRCCRGSVACLFSVRWRGASPSEGGVINRVVQTFTLHFPQG